MFFKPRTESKELLILRLLDSRMELTADEKKNYLYLERGYEGELKFDSLIESAGLDRKLYVLNDLKLKVDNIKFQLDSIIITQNSVILCEVKYYKDDYYYKDGNFHLCTTEKTISNPLHQLNRGKTHLQQFLQRNGFHYPIECHLIFNNPVFFLYNAPQDKPIIFPAHLNRFIHHLDSKPSNLNGKHRQLAELLVEKHIVDPPNSMPPYTYDQLRKGLTSRCCRSFMLKIEGNRIICLECGHQETLEAAVLRNVNELMLLFPEMKITFNIICDWCGLYDRKWKTREILMRNYVLVSKGKNSYYEDK
jgi:hypothetical protein